MNVLRSTTCRCALYPLDNRHRITDRRNSQAPGFVLGTGAILSFCCLERSGTTDALLDVSHLTEVRVSIMDTEGTKVITDQVIPAADIAASSSFTLEEWEAGAKQHFEVVLEDTVTTMPADTYVLVVWGYSNVAPVGRVALGMGSVIVTDLHITDAVEPSVPTVTELEELRAEFRAGLTQCIKRGRNVAGATFTLVDAADRYGITHGVDSTGNPTSEATDYSV
jgi:hypothetical protein